MASACQKLSHAVDGICMQQPLRPFQCYTVGRPQALALVLAGDTWLGLAAAVRGAWPCLGQVAAGLCYAVTSKTLGGGRLQGVSLAFTWRWRVWGAGICWLLQEVFGICFAFIWRSLHDTSVTWLRLWLGRRLGAKAKERFMAQAECFSSWSGRRWARAKNAF
jgi:hypothetical protein